MPLPSRYEIELVEEERRLLERLASSYSLRHSTVLRAQIILLADEGWGNKQIATKLNISSQTVLKWRKRFYDYGLGDFPDGGPPAFASIQDRPRQGRPKSLR